MFASFKSRFARWLFGKSLYDLFPELRDREHVFSQTSSEATTITGIQRERSHQSAAWVYKAVEVWERLFAPLAVQIIGEDGKVLQRHRLHQFLRRMNPDYPNSDLRRRWIRSIALHGEAALELEYDGLLPAAFWFHEADSLGVVPDKNRLQFYGVSGYVIRKHADIEYSLPPHRLYHAKTWNPFMPYRGLSPMSAVRHTVNNDRLAVLWQEFFFRNFAMPGTAIVAPAGMTPKEKKALEQSFAERYGLGSSSWGVFKPLVLEEGITDVKTFSTPAKDIAFLDQRHLNAEEIAGVFGVPPEMMGFRVGKFDNYDVAEQIMWTLTMLSLISLFDDTLTHFLQRIGEITIYQKVRTDLSKIHALRRVLDPVFRHGNYLFAWGAPFSKINEYLDLGFPRFEGDDISNPFGSDVSVGPEGVIAGSDATPSVPGAGSEEQKFYQQLLRSMSHERL